MVDDNDNIIDRGGNDTIHGGAGADLITTYGTGSDLLDGDDGDDRIYANCLADSVINGGAGNDLLQVKCNASTTAAAIASHSNTLNGGTGNDQLRGNASSDLYLFAVGDGVDTIFDSSAGQVSVDEIRFGAGVTLANSKVSRTGFNLVFEYGVADRIVITNWFYNSDNKIEIFRFGDGSSKTGAEMEARITLYIDDDCDGYTELQGDCDDGDDSINPDGVEICGDGLDQDCLGGIWPARGATYTPIPDTGQTQSYTETFGEDSDYEINPPSYTDNGDGTVTDNVTGLMWQQEDDNVTRTWDDALTDRDNLGLAGHTDWRLPNDIELISIVNYGFFDPAIDTTAFPNTDSEFGYWSSTVMFGSNYTEAKMVDFRYGGVHYFLKIMDVVYVRCVRGGL